MKIDCHISSEISEKASNSVNFNLSSSSSIIMSESSIEIFIQIIRSIFAFKTKMSIQYFIGRISCISGAEDKYTWWLSSGSWFLKCVVSNHGSHEEVISVTWETSWNFSLIFTKLAKTFFTYVIWWPSWMIYLYSMNC